MRTSTATLLLAAMGSLMVLAPACSSDDDCEAGTEGCACDDGACDSGLECRSDLCVAGDGDDDDDDSSSTGGGGNTPGAGGSGTASGGSGTGGSGTGGSGDDGSGGDTGTGGRSGVVTGEICYGLPFDGTEPTPDCVGEAHETEALPINIYVMMDRSVSMLREIVGSSSDPAENIEDSRWYGVSHAISEFATDPSVSGVGLGIQFFGADVLSQEEINCDVANYANPMVPIAPLSESGPDIVAAVEEMGNQLGGLTPTMPALQGAIQYAAADAAVTNRTTVVLLITDGQPTQCPDQPSVGDIADEAARGLAEQDVMTFVVGIGPGLFNLHQIAAAGGTGEALLIEEGDAAAQFREAIMNIATTPLSCEFDIPAPTDPTLQIDASNVQMVYTPASGEPEEIPRLGTGANCGNSPNGGWFFNSTSNPETIHICACNCNRLGAGLIEVRLGCEPRVFDIE